MKKIVIGLLAISIFSTVSFGEEKNVSVFSFQGYNAKTQDGILVNSQNKKEENLNISYPLFYQNIYSNMINKTIVKFVNSFKIKNYSYDVSYKITGNNQDIVSVLFEIKEKELSTGNEVVKYEAFTFNLKSGKELEFKDLFLPGAEVPLNTIVNSRVRQFGMTTIDNKKNKFKGVTKNQKLYMEDNAIVLFYNENEATDFGDKVLFVPFLISELDGILK